MLKQGAVTALFAILVWASSSTLSASSRTEELANLDSDSPVINVRHGESPVLALRTEQALFAGYTFFVSQLSGKKLLPPELWEDVEPRERKSRLESPEWVKIYNTEEKHGYLYHIGTGKLSYSSIQVDPNAVFFQKILKDYEFSASALNKLKDRELRQFFRTAQIQSSDTFHALRNLTVSDPIRAVAKRFGTYQIVVTTPDGVKKHHAEITSDTASFLNELSYGFKVFSVDPETVYKVE